MTSVYILFTARSYPITSPDRGRCGTHWKDRFRGTKCVRNRSPVIRGQGISWKAVRGLLWWRGSVGRASWDNGISFQIVEMPGKILRAMEDVLWEMGWSCDRLQEAPGDRLGFSGRYWEGRWCFIELCDVLRDFGKWWRKYSGYKWWKREGILKNIAIKGPYV